MNYLQLHNYIIIIEHSAKVSKNFKLFMKIP